ncbi:unnamed protein product [Sphagnum tenellum]
MAGAYPEDHFGAHVRIFNLAKVRELCFDTDFTIINVAGVFQSPGPFLIAACGLRSLIPQAQRMLEDTVFDLASVTKVFATAPLVAKLVERRWLSWDTPVSAILSDYPKVILRSATCSLIRQGCLHVVPIGKSCGRKQEGQAQLEHLSPEVRQAWMRQLVYKEPLEARVGERCVYSDLSFMLLGYVIEELTSLPLDQAVRKWVWEPMGIKHAAFRRSDRPLSLSQVEKYAATENSFTRGRILQAEVDDDNCWAMGGYGGHAGAFAQASDLLKFARSLIQGEYLTSETLRVMWQRVSEPEACERTLGWDTPSLLGSSLGNQWSRQSVGHLGFTGTALWIDREARLAVTLLSNRVHPSRSNLKIKAFRPQFFDAIRLDLGGL